MSSLTFGESRDGVGGISRREFVKAISVVAAGGTLWALSNRSVIAALTAPMMPSALVRSTFLRHMGETFYIQLASSGSLAVRLVDVRDLRSGDFRRVQTQVSTHGESSFSILFQGANDRLLEQDTYRIEHRQVGRFPLFIVPMVQEAGIQYYEAIFNHQQA